MNTKPYEDTPDWGFDANVKMLKLGLTKRDLAKMLGVNYTQLCNVISGTVKNLTLQEKITTKLEELEEGG